MATTIKRTHEWEISIFIAGDVEPFLVRTDEMAHVFMVRLAQEGFYWTWSRTWYPPHRIHEAHAVWVPIQE